MKTDLFIGHLTMLFKMKNL